jgi:hypothetical protein
VRKIGRKFSSYLVEEILLEEVESYQSVQRLDRRQRHPDISTIGISIYNDNSIIIPCSNRLQGYPLINPTKKERESWSSEGFLLGRTSLCPVLSDNPPLS